MARKDKAEQVETTDAPSEKDVVKLSKLLIKEFNKNEKETGKLAWNLATDLDNPTEVKEWISTGSTLLDYIISNRRNGGIPVGKLTEISGEEASGKSLLCSHLAAEVQRRGGIVAYIDTENAMHPEFAKQLGVDLNKMIYLQPGTIEEVGETIEKVILLTRQKAADKLVLVIWDSVAGTPSQAEIEGNFDPNDRIGVTAKALAKMMRKLTQVLGKERIALVFTNQLKVKIGVMYGDPMTTPGGKAIPYHASVRVRLNRSTLDKAEGKEEEGSGLDALGVNTIAKVVKNRCGPPLRKCRFTISFARGIEDIDSWFEFLHEQKVISKGGGMCYIDEFTQFAIPKAEAALAAAKDDKELSAQIKLFLVKLKSEKGFGFREKQWEATVKETPYLEDWLKDKLESLMVIKFGEKPHDMEMDPESLMETEEVVAELTNPQ